MNNRCSGRPSKLRGTRPGPAGQSSTFALLQRFETPQTGADRGHGLDLAALKRILTWFSSIMTILGERQAPHALRRSLVNPPSFYWIKEWTDRGFTPFSSTLMYIMVYFIAKLHILKLHQIPLRQRKIIIIIKIVLALLDDINIKIRK